MILEPSAILSFVITSSVANIDVGSFSKSTVLGLGENGSAAKSSVSSAGKTHAAFPFLLRSRTVEQPSLRLRRSEIDLTSMGRSVISSQHSATCRFVTRYVKVKSSGSLLSTYTPQRSLFPQNPKFHYLS